MVSDRARRPRERHRGVGAYQRAKTVEGQGRAAGLEGGGVEDQRSELADVAGELVEGEEGEQLLRRPQGALPEGAGGLGEKVLDQERQVLRALAQRRHGDVVDRKPEE